MREVSKAIKEVIGDGNETPHLGPAGLGPPDFEWLAKHFASHALETYSGESLRAALALSAALAEFSRCDAIRAPQ